MNSLISHGALRQSEAKLTVAAGWARKSSPPRGAEMMLNHCQKAGAAYSVPMCPNAQPVRPMESRRSLSCFSLIAGMNSRQSQIHLSLTTMVTRCAISGAIPLKPFGAAPLRVGP